MNSFVSPAENYANGVIMTIIGLVVLVGLVFLIYSLARSSAGRSVLIFGAIGVGLLAFLVLFYMRLAVPTPVVVQDNPVPFGNLPDPVSDIKIATWNRLSLTLLTPLIGLAVVVGIVLLMNRLARSSGGRTALVVGAIGLVLLTMFSVAFWWSKDVTDKSGPVVVKSGSLTRNPSSSIDLIYEIGDKPPAKSATTIEPETTTFTPPATDNQPKAKPAWLTQGTQTGNGVSQFPISSELFSTVAESQRDLDSRMSPLIAAEVRYIIGEEYPISLLPGEAQRLVAETYTEEFPITSNGTWYKIHRLVKIDQTTWAMFRMRFQEANLRARLETLALSFGGLLLVIGVVYLVLRRTPRVVDPTLDTFSTT